MIHFILLDPKNSTFDGIWKVRMREVLTCRNSIHLESGLVDEDFSILKLKLFSCAEPNTNMNSTLQRGSGAASV